MSLLRQACKNSLAIQTLQAVFDCNLTYIRDGELCLFGPVLCRAYLVTLFPVGDFAHVLTTLYNDASSQVMLVKIYEKLFFYFLT
jgi:hypothetical protein